MRALLLGAGSALWLLGVPAGSVASGIQGQCSDCHIMHNSEQGAAVAKVGTEGTVSATPLNNLLRMDCIACHAQGTGERVVTMEGGSKVPQVYHNDPEGDLAAGNFAYITGTKAGYEGTSGNRKGHNVTDMLPADTQQLFPPGYRHATADIGVGGFDVTKFTCAGSMGCHGYRGQVLSTVTADPNCNPEFEECGGDSNVFRTGLAALSGYDGVGTNTSYKAGAHHSNYDGLKNDGIRPDFYDNPLAHSYRFIRALRGYGNQAERWRNDGTSHNEYFGGYADTPQGELIKNTNYNTAPCSRCHVGGSVNSSDSRLTVPGSSITGFCITCHGGFHSSGVTNGASGAFLRHPSDYVIPNKGEYAAYTEYNITAPVARPAAFFVDGVTSSNTVNPGIDQVMCLSCHQSHATPYDGMLRFDYQAIVAGNNPDRVGCLACHTTKGIKPEDRVIAE